MSVRAPFGLHSGSIRGSFGPFGVRPRSENFKGQGPVSQGPVFEFPMESFGGRSAMVSGRSWVVLKP